MWYINILTDSNAQIVLISSVVNIPVEQWGFRDCFDGVETAFSWRVLRS